MIQFQKSNTLTYQAHAKLNLNLTLCGKRDDGYHLLQSLVVFTSLADTLDFEFTDNSSSPLTLNVTSKFQLPEDFLTNNLILKTTAALLERADQTHIRPVKLLLHKRIPLGAGLGGGSADAAAALLALNSIWQLNLDIATLVDIASVLGSDIAACIFSKPIWLEDTGNILTPVSIRLPTYILLAYPQQHANTKLVYENFKGDFHKAIILPKSLSHSELSEFMNCYGNDLESPAIALIPEIGELLNMMREVRGGQYTRMTGSGSACFTFFKEKHEAEEAKTHLKMHFPDYWVQLTGLYSGS